MFILRKFDQNPGSRYHRVGKRRWIFENWERRSSSSSRGGTNVSSLFGRGKKRLVAMSRAKTISIGTERNVVKQRDPEKRNTDERVAMRSIRKKRKGKSPTIETMSCPIAVIAIQRRRRCGRRSSLSSTMSPRPPPFTYIHPSSTYIYIYIRFILAPRATIERITDRVPRDTSPSPPRSRRVSHHGPRSCRKFQDGVECLGGEPHCG